jgi:hypothetical protein
MKAIKEIKLSSNRIFKIFVDDDCIDPRKNEDRMGTMACVDNRKYSLGDKQLSSEEIQEIIEDQNFVTLPLFLYDHSGITMKTTKFSCPWDSGQIGIIYISKQDIIKEYGAFNKENKLKAIDYMRCEVKTYDNYLTGNIYGFQLVEKKTCECCSNVDEEVIDSCWGLNGDDFKNNGILDNLDKEDLKEVLKHL